MPSRAPKHAKHYRITHGTRTFVACLVIGILLFIATFAGALYTQVTSNIGEAAVDFIKLDAQGNAVVDDSGPLDPYDGQAINILVMGQDTRDGEANAALGGGNVENEHQADTTMVVQIAADRSYINIVSIPRDSLVDRPKCTMSNGSVLDAADGVMFNSVFAAAYQQGGDLASAASCTVHTVNTLTGMDISEFVVVDFAGMSQMIDAIGGVDICLPTDVNDAYSGLDLDAGVQHLSGTQATQYARTRHGLGDGSDIMRTTRQQYLVKRLIKTALQKNMLTQSNQLYQFALTALDSLSMSSGLANASTLVGLAMTFSNFSIDHMYTMTIPVITSPDDPNRVVWADSADAIWEKMRTSQPLQDSGDSSSSASASASSSESSSSAASDSSSSDATASVDSAASSDSTASTQTYQYKEDTDDSSSSTPSASSSSKSSSSSSSSSSASADPTDTMTTQQRIDYYTSLGGTYNASTQLMEQPNGTLIDPATNGYVDPSDGTIRDQNTGYAIGIAYNYMTLTFCPSLM
ncbi:LCP family protein [Pseudoscardovia radai]|uniref:LCP family protein n=1 Tax=Pseudoscardovia radai TaxID=987066 RepID=UPI003996AFFA